MDIILIFLIISGAVVLIMTVLNIVLLVKLSRVNKNIDNLLDQGKIKSFKSIFLGQKEKNEDIEDRIEKIILRIKKLEEISEITIRKIGVVRFNPFSNLGGDQSFVIAMLDNKNNGFLISSLFVEDSNRVYAKFIKDGKSDRKLSKEEVEAINRATN